MIDIKPHINLEGLYMVKFDPSSNWNCAGHNDYKPAIITRYTGPTKPELPRL